MCRIVESPSLIRKSLVDIFWSDSVNLNVKVANLTRWKTNNARLGIMMGKWRRMFSQKGLLTCRSMQGECTSAENQGTF